LPPSRAFRQAASFGDRGSEACCRARDVAGTRDSRNAGQQHSMRHTRIAPPPSTATEQQAGQRGRQAHLVPRRGRLDSERNRDEPRRDRERAHTAASPRSHSAAARLAKQPAITT